MKELELYFHIPFCERKCAYCDFLSAPADPPVRISYIKKLQEEIAYYGPQFKEYQVSSIFFGGGTPTILEGYQLAAILETVKKYFHLVADAEITVECNPGTLTAGKAEKLVQAGFNRLSMGLQSADDRELQLLGRIHNFAQFLESYDLARKAGAAENTLVYQMPLGNYTDFQVEPSCGLAGMNGVIDTFDDPRSFYSTDRQQAQLIWFSRGYIEYRFPNKINPLWNIREMNFSMELCSEAPGYNAQWPSDITFSVNGTEIGTYTCPGDLGARRGRLTPNVWPIGLTQYGFMTGVSLRKDGCYINEIKVNDENILETVRLSGKPYISLRIGVRPDAINQGGINLFGEKYGDFPQGINMRIVY